MSHVPSLFFRELIMDDNAQLVVDYDRTRSSDKPWFVGNGKRAARGETLFEALSTLVEQVRYDKPTTHAEAVSR